MGTIETKKTNKVNTRTIQVLNIVLLHNQKPESYVDLFKNLLQEDYVVDLKGDKHIELLSFRKLATIDMYEGTFVTYVDIRPDAWFNPDSKEIETREDFNGLQYGNAKRATFFLVPNRHKLCLFSGGDVSIQHVKAYLEGACRRLLGEGQVHINYVTSKDDIKSAYDNLNITRVKLTLNYSNRAHTSGIEQVFDDAAKADNIALINIELAAANKESITMEEGGMTDSLLNLATTLGNGSAEVVGVEVIQPTGRKKKVRTKNRRIRTSDYISKFKIMFYNMFDLPMAIYNEIMTYFKEGE